MARNQNYLKMQEMGEWLEELLAPKVENWKIKELFRRAVNLIDLYYNINHDHPSFKFLDEITEKGEGWYNSQPGGILGSPFKDSIVNNLASSISILSNLLRIIHNRGQPWEITMKKIFNETPDADSTALAKKYMESIAAFEATERSKEIDIEKLKSKMNDVKRTAVELAKLFRFQDAQRVESLYSRIGEKLILQENGLKKVKVLLDVTKGGEIVPMTTTPSGKALPFAIISSRIFFDFLLMGGQEYYSYCMRCGQFIVAQRKGRRKTCSDACRLALHHEKK